jgi:anhydro-N-acetylmuramic acid kinase
MQLAIGVMSGTSIDAVDTVLVDFAGSSPTLLASHSRPWPTPLGARLHAYARGQALTADALAVLDTEAGLFFGEVISGLLDHSGFTARDVAVIGCHGQTVAHLPDNRPPTTLQLGDASVIAERTGITTVNDFRRRDMAAGGQGAPLAPAFHAGVLGSPDEDRVVLNLGGIANITVLPRRADVAPLGFDTGPANCLSDGWTRRHRGLPFDEGGQWAAAGTPDRDLLDRMLGDPYFVRPPPKSTGTQYFSAVWLDACCEAAGVTDPGSVQSTILHLTVASVGQAVATWAGDPARVLVCGGGVNNPHLLKLLGESLGIPVESTAGYGIPPQAMEGMAFAWLAWQTLQGRAGNLPSITGAVGNRILGAIHPA